MVTLQNIFFRTPLEFFEIEDETYIQEFKSEPETNGGVHNILKEKWLIGQNSSSHSTREDIIAFQMDI